MVAYGQVVPVWPHPPAARSPVFIPPWGQLPEEIWALIIAQLDFYDQLSMQETCRRFMQLLASTPGIWGRVEMTARETNSSSSVWRICNWVRQRAKGITALGYIFSSGDSQQRQHMTRAWHALVASTAGTGIRLRLACDFFGPTSLLLPPSRTELVQRLTALAISVTSAVDVAVVHSLAALRQLRMESSAAANALLYQTSAGGSIPSCQLTGLCTLLLSDMPPAAFFLPDTAARLQCLHSLSVKFWPLPEGVLPPGVLQLPALSRLELLQLPLRTMPDLRRLPALRELAITNLNGVLSLDASQAECSAELKAALRENPLGGAMGLTEVVVHGVPITTQECAEAIERLPHLNMLALDYLGCTEGAFWAATLQQRMQARCSVEFAPEHIIVNNADEETIMPFSEWPDEDW